MWKDVLQRRCSLVEKKYYTIYIITRKDGGLMEQVLKEILSPSNQYNVQIFKRKDGFFTIELYRWQEDYEYEYWSPIKF
ncbi:hypothetical protein C3943_18645 [Lysinibacillus sp. B2A1]|nr:hypothetical protein C3943_18645 [Lysinibacillus sp. B2A1]